MCSHEVFWRTYARPSHPDGKATIFERKLIRAESVEEARQEVAKLPAEVVLGVAHQPALIENFYPTQVL